jgi:hypothetical protein
MKNRPFSSIYTQVEWKTKYCEQGSEFLSETLPQLWCLGDPDNVRIVIWFDN